MSESADEKLIQQLEEELKKVKVSDLLVQTLYTVSSLGYSRLGTELVEPVFNTHPDVPRTALVGIGAPGAQRPVLCVELRAGIRSDAHARIAAELQHLGEGFVHTAKVETFLFHPKFPVDIRHNAKIGREQLASWAAGRLRKQGA